MKGIVMNQWTETQKKVIFSPAKKLICSAAAGSGKTAVMIERIVRFLKEGTEPSSFLVVTFTNAAASEMKEKIRKRLQEEKSNPMIRTAIDQMDTMQISTIHSFCQLLLRNQFQLIGIDPDFTICDTYQQEKLFHEAFTEACNCMKEQENEIFCLLRSRFDTRQAEDIIKSLHSFLMSLYDPFQWLSSQIDSVPDRVDESHSWFKTLNRMAFFQIKSAELTLYRMYNMFQDSFALDAYRESWHADEELFHVKQLEISQNKPDMKPCRFAKLKIVKGLTVQESDWKERYQKLRDEFKKQMKQLDDLLLSDPAQTLTEWKNVRESLLAIQRLMILTEENFTLLKKTKALVDFSDLEQYAVKILQSPEGQTEAHETWRHIFVDECQDISDVQDKIIDLLHTPDDYLFMVGDVKQSIYRFRLADPGLFLNRIRKSRETISPDQECIFLQSNFRSRPEILETTNLVFQSIMKESVTELDYGPEERLIPGRKVSGSEPVQIQIISKGETDLKDLEAVAEFISREISLLLTQFYPEKNRYYQYRDCVILLPAVHTDGPLLAEMIKEEGIPVFFDGSGEYYQLHEVQVIRNLLEWIDNPLQDLPLLSVLQEPPFSFSEEEISLIRLKYPDTEIPYYEAFSEYVGEKSDLGKKCGQVMEKLRGWQDLAETAHVPELIWKLYHETGIYYLLSVDPAGEVKQANLRMLAEQAAEAETHGIISLRDFLAYMRDQQSFGDQQSATLLGEQDNLVRIMTIHKSKGLQFPVVFCAGMDKSPWGRDSGNIRFHADLGLCVNYKDPEHRISRPTLADQLFSFQKKKEEMAEKVRLLYVAMTRAQEKLYLLTCQETNPIWTMPESDGRILSAKTYTDWWMPVFYPDKDQKLSTGYTHEEKPYEIRVYECNQQKPVENNQNMHSLSSWLESVLSAPVVDELWTNPENRNNSPTLVKRSVSALIRSARKQFGEEEETAETKRMPDQLERWLRQSEMEELPAFLQKSGKMTAAWRGTLTHRFLSMISLDSIRRGENIDDIIRLLKNEMMENHMATAEELAQVNENQIAAFFRSEMGRRLIRSPEVHREWNFNLLLQREQPVILQGVIDCAFREEEKWVILDYKTDRGKTAEQMAEEYRPQLLWYAQAVAHLTGQQVREAALYSLSLDQVIPVFVGNEK